MFGESVHLKFQGKDKFTTPVGAVISCLTLSMFFSFFIVRTMQLMNSDNPNLTMVAMASDEESINLHQHQFFFAIQEVDPKVGRIEITLTQWTKG